MITNSPVKIWRTQKKIAKHLGKEGIIESYTIIKVPPLGFENLAPYPVVLVALNKEKLIGQLVDYEKEDIRIGRKVEVVLRRVKQPSKEGIIPYGIKFKPV